MALSPSVEAVTARPGAATHHRLLLHLCLVVVAVRASYLLGPLRYDEAGYLFIARRWRSGGEFLYGDYFVDRPPLLMLVFKVAALTEWDHAIRLVAIPFVLAFVVGGWYAGGVLAGRSGARWAAVVSAGLMCSPALGADAPDGEVLGSALVMSSIALALRAWHDRRRRRFWLAVAAGLLAAAAPLVKQSLVEAVVFLAVLLAVGRLRGRRSPEVAAGAALGVLVTFVALASWVWWSGSDVASVWRELVAVRGDALGVLWSDGSQVSTERLAMLAALGTLGGVLPVVLVWIASARRWRRLGEEGWAVCAVVPVGLAAIAAGGSYWPSYALQLAPAVVLAVAVLAPARARAGRWMRAAASVVVGAAVVGSVVAPVVYSTRPAVWADERTGEWLGAAKAPGDTAFVAYGHATILETADAPSPYPHLWSLPMRTLDPRQERLRATLAGPVAPSWVVEVNDLDAWRIDRGARLRSLLQERYRVVADVCGNQVWLRRDLSRDAPPPPRC